MYVHPCAYDRHDAGLAGLPTGDVACAGEDTKVPAALCPSVCTGQDICGFLSSHEEPREPES
jgi:hypothetical protein